MFDFFEEVYKLTRQIPKGRISTYGAIAKALGDPVAARAVGVALNLNPNPDYTPCYKIVNSDGTLGGFGLGIEEKIRRLKKDGILVTGGKILNFEKILFDDFKTNYPLKILRREQIRLSKKIFLEDATDDVKTVAGVDIAYSKKNSRDACGAFVTINIDDSKIIEQGFIKMNTNFPYIPTYLTYRELPIIKKLFKHMENKPDVIMIDGNGILHPYGIGIASHAGLTLGIPAIGVAKGLLYGIETNERLANNTNKITDDNGKMIGFSLKVNEKVKPVFVSPGYKISFDKTLEVVKRLQKYRIPEPIRQAHILAKKQMKSTL
ncbi:MAG: endonuclease V [Thermoplasmata archaeon]|nr:MAG: endonuclease V [Thermoplasmata archaeon]